MGRTPRAPRPAPPPRPPRGVRLVSYVPNDTREATPYVARWHRVLAWAQRSTLLPGFEPVELSKVGLNHRVTREAVACVRDLRDAEEAFERGLPLEALGNLPRGPRRDLGGYRRCLVTALTWKADQAGEVGYDPAWITLGWGMTAHEAAAAVHRFILGYRSSDRDAAGYELVITALEVKFWTASESADYV